MMTLERPNALALVNEVLSRCGQKPVTSLSVLTTPVRQALGFLNQVQEDVHAALALPGHTDELSLAYSPTGFTFDLATLDIHSGLIQPDTFWVRPTGETGWSKLAYAPEHRQLPEVSGAACPAYYFFQRETLVLGPPPTKGGALRFLTLRPNTDLRTAQDLSSLPYGAEQTLILGAVAYLQHFLGDVASATLYQKQFEAAVFQLKKKYQRLFQPARFRGPRPGAQPF
jgi:hypothetical protein